MVPVLMLMAEFVGNGNNTDAVVLMTELVSVDESRLRDSVLLDDGDVYDEEVDADDACWLLR